MGLYVQYGCGFSAPEGWLSFDASPTLRFERLPLLGRLYTRNAQRFPARVRYGDILRGLPVDDGSCAGVYASHVLEHLSFEEARLALRRTHSLLAHGGIFRAVLPDLLPLARTYLARAAAGDPGAAADFLDAAGLGRRQLRSPRQTLLDVLGRSAHLWMWDEASLARELRSAGFREIRRCSYGDCPDPQFQLVEQRDRFEDALAMEARR